jgi:hypothetical protein
MRKLYNCLFRKILFVKDFVMYRLSNFVHKPVVVFSETILNRTSSTKHRRMTINALASISSRYSSVMDAGCFAFPKSAFTTPCCTSRSCILTFQISKLFLPLNFSISNLALCIFFIKGNIKTNTVACNNQGPFKKYARYQIYKICRTETKC